MKEEKNSMADTSNSSQEATAGAVYLCIKQFNARLGDELSLKIGDKIEVLADDSEYNDGWYMGKNIATSEVGLYPKSFTQLLHKENPDTLLLRSRSRRVMNRNGSKLSKNPDNPSKLGEKMLNMSLNSSDGTADSLIRKEKNTDQAHITMNDIDQALQELQSESFMPATNTPQLTDNKEKTHKRSTSDQFLNGDFDTSQVKYWSPEEVSSYFAMVLGFDMDTAGKFARHKITGTILLELSLTHLKELDIDSFGTRFEVYKEIENLRTSSQNKKNLAQTNRNGKKGSHVKPSNIDELVDYSESELISSITSKPSSPYKLHSLPNNSDEDTNITSYSKSQSQLLPSASLTSSTPSKGAKLRQDIPRHQRKRSLSMDNAATRLGSPEPEMNRKTSNMSSSRNTPSDFDNSLNQGYKFGSYQLPSEPKTENYGSYQPPRFNNGNATGLGIINGSRPSSSVYEQSVNSHSRNISSSSAKNHRRNSSYISGHKRHSSLFLFVGGNGEAIETNGWHADNNHKEARDDGKKEKLKDLKKDSKLSGAGSKDIQGEPVDTPSSSKRNSKYYSLSPKNTEIDIDNAKLSPPKLKLVSYKNPADVNSPSKNEKRVTSENSAISRFKTLRTASTQNFRNLTTLKKLKTSAFTEGIREITPTEAIKTANFSGWMAKKSGSNLGWRSRYFTLHGTRLLYFTSLKDKRERGLIDITAHKVIPIHSDNENNSSNDKYIALYAASTGFGRYCFKIIPPAPGFKKGLTFTQPKTHYFAVESQEDMRGWLKALMTATIDIDDSIPVVSSCSTPTVSLSKAQELLAKAREETKQRDEENTQEKNKQIEEEEGIDTIYRQFMHENDDDMTSEENSPIVESQDESTLSTYPNTSQSAPKLNVDTNLKKQRNPSTPQLSSQPGFSSPYLLASGLLSPKLAVSQSSGGSTPNLSLGQKGNLDYFPELPDSHNDTHSKFSFSNGRVISGSSLGRKKKNQDKMLAYSNDGSGNHTFVIKPKK